MPAITESDLQEIKDILMELKISQARMDEKLDAINNNVSDLKKQVDKQDNRLWVLVSGMFLVIIGALTKFAFFPNP
jgi:predicted nuclease with TOPRIM domain